MTTDKTYLQWQETNAPKMVPLTVPDGVRLPPGRVIVLMKFGSHLYGTDTPKSDTDYKGVFMPERRSVLLGRVPRTVNLSTGTKDAKNTADDVDVEWLSLHEFIKLACEGQTVALDMLHAPREWPEVSSCVWKELRLHAHRFNTKNLQAFLGYCKRQAAKYGVKGSRLAAVREVIRVVESSGCGYVGDLSSVLPTSEHVEWAEDGGGRHFLVVCGRKLQTTLTVEQALVPLRKFEENYGERARQAAANEGVDWKAVSHALRAGYELEELYQTGRITFPLKDAAFLREVKQGAFDFTTEVEPMLDACIQKVEKLAAESSYPEKVNRVWWDDWLEQTVGSWV